MISVYLLLDLCPCPFPCPFPCLSPSPAQTPPQTPARPRLPSVPVPPSPSVSLPPPSPATETGVGVARACGAAPSGDGNGRRCRPGVRRGTIGRRNGAEVSPGRAVMHCWATETGVGVARECGAAPLGDGNGSKCSPSVR